MMIRQAHPSDNKRIAELCFMIWEDMELDIVNEISKERLMNILELSVVNVEYRSYYKNVWVYEVDGKVAGCVIAYDGKHELDYEENWLKLPLDEDIRKYGTPLPVKEAADDEMYIETVATFPEYRGQGIATQLMTYLLEMYSEKKWSLNCDYDNEKALGLYEKLGFKTVSDIDLYGHLYRHMIMQ